MAELIEINELQNIIETSESFGEREFDITKSISHYYNTNSRLSNNLILIALNYKDKFTYTRPVINDLAREIGLFPYLNPEELSLEDLIAYEFHRPEGKGIDNVVFHKVQAQVYYEILKGQNIILSAPTSFGKSLVIDAVIAIEKFDNIVIIVPTIALIDETRKRLSKFKSKYKIITHNSQEIVERNIFVLTQERVIDMIPEDTKIDFFVIDEFYKIGLTTTDVQRAITLNQAFYKLLQKNAQFYLLGPNIENINNSYFPQEITFKYIRTDYSTVVNRRELVRFKGKAQDKLVELCSEIEGPTLIYCKSPNSINKVAKALYDSGIGEKQNDLSELTEWIREEYHPSWYLADYLDSKIGIHHGRLPRSISQYILNAFNEGKLDFLICTSTIIEGVNTKSKNVIIYDNRIAQNKFDFFTYNNICGRSGRMFSHFIGNVYLFHEPPAEELPLVDFPLFTQLDTTPSRLLLQMDEKDLNENSKKRVDDLMASSDLTLDTLKSNSSIEPEYQNNLAQNILKYEDSLKWTYLPNYDELSVICKLIWDFFVIPSNSKGYIYSEKQLTFKINRVIQNKDIKSLIAVEVGDKSNPDEINKAIESEINFIKYWPQYNFPIYLRSLQNIAEEVLGKKGKKVGDFNYLATQLECLFNHPLFNVLEEYGLPMQISKKMKKRLNLDKGVDELFSSINDLKIESLPLEDFEKDMVQKLKSFV